MDTEVTQIVELVEGAIEAREEKSIPRHYIVDAIEKIKSGKIILSEEESYPSGFPGLKVVADHARRLWKESYE